MAVVRLWAIRIHAGDPVARVARLPRSASWRFAPDIIVVIAVVPVVAVGPVVPVVAAVPVVVVIVVHGRGDVDGRGNLCYGRG